MKLYVLLALAGLSGLASTAKADAAFTEAAFRRSLARFEERLVPIAAEFGATLTTRPYWNEELRSDGTGGPGGARICGPDETWIVCIVGGVARHPLVTSDVLDMVLCHELGHYAKAHAVESDWSIEESADHYAAAVCLKRLWGDEFAEQRALTAALGTARYAEWVWEHFFAPWEVRAPSLDRRAEPTGDPAQCRLDIYRSGIENAPRPACSWSR